MPALRIRLFGTLEIRRAGRVQTLEGRKSQELLCYLLLARGRRCHREMLATLLWPEASASQSKKYLRQAAWRVHAGLDSSTNSEARVLTASPDWLQISADAPVHTDVERFEAISREAELVAATPLDAALAGRLREAVELYRGDLLENWYQDWCLFERERLQNLYLGLLDMLCIFHELRHETEAAIVFALRILRADPVREQTHQRLMRLYQQAGDRAGALRQFDRCEAALRDELGVPPSRETLQLRRQICDGGNAPAQAGQGGARLGGNGGADLAALRKTLEALRRLQPSLTELHAELERHIAVLDRLA
jgi:DNA-binding SARP family transcriptional activator